MPGGIGVLGEESVTRRPFTISAEEYDLIYQNLPYDEQARLVAEAIRARRPAAQTLLEVGCGTGQFHSRLRESFDVEGVDLYDLMAKVHDEMVQFQKELARVKAI